MVTKIWVNIGSGNGLLPDGTKPLPEPMLSYQKFGPVTFTWGQFHKRYLSHWPLKSAWKLLIWNLLWISQGPMSWIVKLICIPPTLPIKTRHMLMHVLCCFFFFFFSEWGKSKLEFSSVTKHWSVLVRPIDPGETHNKLTHKIWTQSHKPFLWECPETAWPIKGPGNGRYSAVYYHKLIRSREYPIEFSHQIWALYDCLQMWGNCLTNQRPGNGKNLMECDHKLIKPGESHNEFIYQIWAQFNQQFIYKCAELLNH